MKLVLLLSFGLVTIAAFVEDSSPRFAAGQIKGAWLADVGGAPLDGPFGAAALKKLKGLGANLVAIGPDVMMADFTKPDLTFGERDRELRGALRAARTAGLDVLLLPRIECPAFFAESKPWRGDLAMAKPADWTTWFGNYEKMIAHYGALARDEDVAWLGIGLEYRKTARAHPDAWRRVAAVAKAAFKGPITYSANWDDFEQVEWWDAVDAIGIGAYFELLPERGQGSTWELRRGWSPIKEKLAAFSARWKRPVLFTEVGYTTFADTGYRPWEWQRLARPLDPRAQADAWRALFDAFLGEPWWKGVCVWRFYTDANGASDWDYTPEAKEAEVVIRGAFSR